MWPRGLGGANGKTKWLEVELDDFRLVFSIKKGRLPLSNERRAPGCLGYIGDYTTQLFGAGFKHFVCSSLFGMN